MKLRPLWLQTIHYPYRKQWNFSPLNRQFCLQSQHLHTFPAVATRALRSAAMKETDYSSWTNGELIERVSELEAQLRRQNAMHQHSRASSATSPPTPKKKPRKAKKQFDPDRYHTHMIALRFAYLGGNYNGFEHHNNNTTPLPTIEEELWKALRKTRLIMPKQKEEGPKKADEEVCWDGCDYSKCGRTDRGVSAFGQVIGIRVRSSRPKAREVHGGVVMSMEEQQQPEEKEMATVEDVGPMPDEGNDKMANKETTKEETFSSTPASAAAAAPGAPPATISEGKEEEWDPVRDELPYIQLLNRVLPPDIRILAWCPSPPENFSARFSCKERRYRYFFTNPAYMPLRGSNGSGSSRRRRISCSSSSLRASLGQQAEEEEREGNEEGWLDIAAMNEAAKKYEGLHDFRNFCKVDPSKQISNFQRRIFHAGIHEVHYSGGGDGYMSSALSIEGGDGRGGRAAAALSPKLYYFEVRGSAFLWHQVRHLVAILFLVGQRYERPDIVDELLDIQKMPGKPVYEMASDIPLVLWDCIFPNLDQIRNADHGREGASNSSSIGYEDGLSWIYAGEGRSGDGGGSDNGGLARLPPSAVENSRQGRYGILEELWALWRKRKMDEVLAWSLLDVVVSTTSNSPAAVNSLPTVVERSARVFDGSEKARTVGDYVPIAQRERMDTPDIVNARYAARKGIAICSQDNDASHDREIDDE